MWRRKKRLNISGLSLFYTICGCVLVLGNIYIMHSGFVQMLDDPERTYGRSLQQVSSSRLGIAEMLDDIPALALPDSLRAARSAGHFGFNEPKLRRLMEKDTPSVKLFGEPGRMFEAHSRTEGSHNVHENGFQQRLAKGWKDDAVLSVSDSELRAVLNKTSNCAKLQSLGHKEYIASGWTKAVYKAEIGGRPVALKTVDRAGHDMLKCGQQLPAIPLSLCYRRASQKILKELLLLRALDIPNVVQVSVSFLLLHLCWKPELNLFLMTTNHPFKPASCFHCVYHKSGPNSSSHMLATSSWQRFASVCRI